VVSGLTLKVLPLMAKVGAPEATTLYEVPEQIEPLDAVIVGLAFTDTVITAVLDEAQPPVLPVIE
jgi:hypothetical protein